MITTPRCTTMPPLARPTNPRHPSRRHDAPSWRRAAAAANAPRPNATNGASPRRPATTHATTTVTAAHAGSSRRRCNKSVEAFRHGRAGAIAMRNSSVKPIGIVMRSKYGAPIDSPSPLHERRMQVRGRGEPREERGVLHGIPRPVPAPAEDLVGPPRAEDDADGEEAPGHERPPAGLAQPSLAHPSGDQRRQRERER